MSRQLDQLARQLLGGIARAREQGADAQPALASGAVDAVVFGKAFLANPDLVERFRAQAALNPVDFTGLYTPGPAGYTDYPSLAA